MIRIVYKIIVLGLWLISLLGTWETRAQNSSTPLDDLAYALENTSNRQEVVEAMQRFHTNTEVALAIATVFENGVYAANSQQNTSRWLQEQPHGIAISITLAEETKAFRRCEMQVSSAVEAWLPEADRQLIQTGLMEFYFRSTPIPTDAYTTGLLAGLEAMEKKILENKEKEVDTTPDELPDLVRITDIDEEFSAGIADYSDNTLHVSYTMEKHETYDLKVAKFEIYDSQENLVYNSEKEGNRVPIQEEGQLSWDGKMNVGAHEGKYIRYENSPFTVKLMASTNALYEDVFMADTTASVDEDADKWRDFKFKDAIVDKSMWSFKTFKGLKERYNHSMNLIGLNGTHPLDYLNESLVPVKFLGQGPILLNIRFAYVLKLFEQSLSTSKQSEYESYLNTVSFDSKLRMSALGNASVSNHALGFALDLDALENPMITDSYLYHFIEFVTGIESFYGRRDRTNDFVDELKSAHNIFVERLKLHSEEPVTWNALISSAEKIEAFENREPDTEITPLYFLADVANNVPSGDVEAIKVSIRNLDDANITEEEILESCDEALTELDLIKTQINALQNIFTEYKQGMLREHFIPTELAALEEYLTTVTEQIETSKTNIDELKEYVALNNIEQLYHDFLNYLNGLFEGEEEQVNFDKVNQLNDLNNHVTVLYEGFKTIDGSLDNYKKYLEKVKERVDKAGVQYGKKMMSYGFFNLKSNFIKDWFAIDYSYWGGFYKDNHDFMHIEVYNSSYVKNNGFRRLHEENIEFYKNFFQEHYPDEYSEMFDKQ